MNDTSKMQKPGNKIIHDLSQDYLLFSLNRQKKHRVGQFIQNSCHLYLFFCTSLKSFKIIL